MTMAKRLSDVLTILWIGLGLLAAGFVIWLLFIRNTEPFATDAIAAIGGAWFSILSFWAGYMERARSRLETRLGERIDRMEERIAEKLDSLEENISQRLDTIDVRIQQVEDHLNQRIDDHIQSGHP